METSRKKLNDVNIKINQRTIPLSVVLIVISSILFIPLVIPLFHPGPPINSDIGVHYSAIKCIYDSGQWSVPTAWCAHGQAGLARFQRYGVVHAYLTLFLALFLPFEIAFKTMMVLGFLILPIVAYFFLRRLGYPLAGALAYTLLLFEPGGQMWGGYGLHFVITGFINSTATGLSLLTIMCAIWMLEKPMPKRIATTSLVTAIYFLTHPASALWLPIAGVPITILYWKEIKENWKILIYYPLIFLGLISFWLIPAIAKSGYFNPPGIVGSISETVILEALVRLTAPQLWLIAIGILSALFLIVQNNRTERIVGSVVFLIFGVWLFSAWFPRFPYFRFFTIERSAYELRTFLIISAALMWGGLCNSWWGNRRKYLIQAVSVLFFTLLILFFQTDLKSSSEIRTGQEIEPTLTPIYSLLNKTEGRVLAENTFMRANASFTFTQPWAISKAYSNKEFLGNSDFWYTKDDYSLNYKGFLFYRNLSNYSNREILQIFWALNIQYIWGYSPQFLQRFDNLVPVAWDFTNGLGWGVIFETPWDHSYLSFPNGTLLQTDYSTLNAFTRTSSEKGGVLFFKVREWPNWKATIDGKPLAIKKGAMGLMEVDVPAGKHTIRFDYGLIRVDWIGYLVTLIAAIATGWWVYANTKIPEKPVPQ